MSSSSTRGIIVAAVPAFGADSAGTSVTALAAWMSYRAARSRRRSVSAPNPHRRPPRPRRGLREHSRAHRGVRDRGVRVRAGSDGCRRGRRALHGTSCMCRCVGAGSGRGAASRRSWSWRWACWRRLASRRAARSTCAPRRIHVMAAAMTATGATRASQGTTARTARATVAGRVASEARETRPRARRREGRGPPERSPCRPPCGGACGRRSRLCGALDEDLGPGRARGSRSTNAAAVPTDRPRPGRAPLEHAHRLGELVDRPHRGQVLPAAHPVLDEIGSPDRNDDKEDQTAGLHGDDVRALPEPPPGTCGGVSLM